MRENLLPGIELVNGDCAAVLPGLFCIILLGSRQTIVKYLTMVCQIISYF